MKLQEMVERVQQHHPDMGVTEIVKSLNDAMNDMGFKTDIVESADQFETIVNQRVYKLKKHIIKIKAVDYDGKTIKKLLGRPLERDLT
jgi:hypothetical protein|tara:strand:+ start:1442 stop:1705 length:264 start_codon:yes stop_codon:yes gene_type:complete